MRRFYFAPVPGIPIADQKKLAEVQGWHEDHAATYEDSKSSYPSQYNKLVEHHRAGRADEIWVSDLAVIIQSRGEFELVQGNLTASGSYIFEGRTGLRSNKAVDWAKMVLGVSDHWSRKKLATKQAKLIGAKGGRKRGKGFAERRLPKGEASKIWADKMLDEQEALDKINSVPGYAIEWTRSSAHRHFGPRGTPTGPRKARR